MIGAIELNLLSYMPLLDPVEKNRLKKLYVQEDQTHLQQLITAYDFMKIVMNYNSLGETVLESFRIKLEALRQKEKSLLKKVALRPAECLYSNLVKDVNHFLRTCCHPKALLELINAAEDVCNANNIQLFNEIIKRIDLWINNADQFSHHTLNKYSAYYRDFLNPVENSITMMKFGLTGLRHCLGKMRDSFSIQSTTTPTNDALSSILENLIEFPSVNGLNVFAKDDLQITTVLNKLDDHDASYFT